MQYHSVNLSQIATDRKLATSFDKLRRAGPSDRSFPRHLRCTRTCCDTYMVPPCGPAWDFQKCSSREGAAMTGAKSDSRFPDFYHYRRKPKQIWFRILQTISSLRWFRPSVCAGLGGLPASAYGHCKVGEGSELSVRGDSTKPVRSPSVAMCSHFGPRRGPLSSISRTLLKSVRG